MENTTKILAGATCALAVAAAGGCWIYGIYAAGKAFDEAALTNFESVLPAELSARVTNYQGGFFKKNFVVSFEAAGGFRLGTFQGEAYPGIRTQVQLERASDPDFETSLARAGVRGFNDRIHVAYTAWDAITSSAQALPSSRFTYTIQPFSITSGGECRFEEFRFEAETGDVVKVSAKTPGIVCRPAGLSEFKLGNFSAAFETDAESIAKALQADETALAETRFSLTLGPTVGGAARFEGVDFRMHLTPEKGKDTWQETVEFKLDNPASPALYLEFGRLGAIDYLKGSMRVTGITERLSEQFAGILVGPAWLQSDLLTLSLLRAVQDDGVVMHVDSLTASVNGSEALLKGAIAGEDNRGTKLVTGRFAFEAVDTILPPDWIDDLAGRGYLLKEKGKVKSELVLTPSHGMANGVRFY